MKPSFTRILFFVLTVLTSLTALVFAVVGVSIHQIGLTVVCLAILAIASVFLRKDVAYFLSCAKK